GRSSDTLHPVPMSSKVNKSCSTIRVRLAQAHSYLIARALTKLLWSYQKHQKSGASFFTYPFRNYPPPRGFDRGAFNQIIMDKILGLGEALTAKGNKKRWMELDTLQLRAAAFAVRAHVDYVRLVRRQQRRKAPEVKASLHIDDKSLSQLKEKTKHVIRSLERHMKRANRALINGLGKEHYDALMATWKAHLRWMRLHIAYYKPWGKPNPGRRRRQQKEIDELMEMAKQSLRNYGYLPPEEKELRHIMRLYARYARDFRKGHRTVRFLLKNRAEFSYSYRLAHFVIKRLNLKELPKS
ncbi:MAG TPA: hypothetical protein VKB38_18505, partial [Terracidiphilus sp.]|nr:hypothetical protein [Terracidiphilus sp.]HKF49357.1 hypothetical protein [Terracidiphilus sp.]